MESAKKQNNLLTIFGAIRQNKLISSLYIILSILQSVITFFVLILTAKAVEFLTLENFDSLIKCGILLLIIFLINSIIGYVKNLFFVRLKLRTLNMIENKFIDRILKISNDVYNSLNSGALTARINVAPSQLFNYLIMFLDTSTNVIMQLCAVIYIASSNIILAGLVVLALIIIFVFKIIIQKNDRKKSNEAQDSFEELQGKTIEFIKGNKDIKCLSMNDTLNAEMDNLLKVYCKKNFKYEVWFYFIEAINSIILSILSCAMLYVGIVLYENLFITYFALIFIINSYERISRFVNKVLAFLRLITQINVNKKRINQVLRDDLMPIDTFGDKDLVELNGKIEFRNVKYFYEDTKLNQRLNDDLKTKRELKKLTKKHNKDNKEDNNLEEPKLILNDFNLTINPGEKVALVGKSGCGKSTLVGLLTKAMTPKSGEILLDGVPYNELSEDAIRGNITVVNQFPYIYFSTLRDNIKIAKPSANDEEILQACDKAYLTDFIKELPYGLDTILGENGVKLSGGQKQRVAIARAFLRETKIMVFDESTSSLDNLAQQKVQNSIDAIEGRTVIIVAHRLSTIMNCDRIIFIDNGKVEAEGKFDELMSKSKKFAELYTLRR